jgi:hypothetical protein
LTAEWRLLALAPFTGSQVRPSRAKRQGGARPPRPRHCDRGRNPQTNHWRASPGRARRVRTIRESGDLPGHPALLTGLRGESPGCRTAIPPSWRPTL